MIMFRKATTALLNAVVCNVHSISGYLIFVTLNATCYTMSSLVTVLSFPTYFLNFSCRQVSLFRLAFIAETSKYLGFPGQRLDDDDLIVNLYEHHCIDAVIN